MAAAKHKITVFWCRLFSKCELNIILKNGATHNQKRCNINDHVSWSTRWFRPQTHAVPPIETPNLGMGKGKSIAPDPKKEAELLQKKLEKAENDLIKACKNDELSRAKKCAPAALDPSSLA